MGIDAEEAKNIAKTLLEQTNNIINIRADLNGGTWKVLVDTFHKQIEVLLNAEDGRVMGFTFLKGK